MDLTSTAFKTGGSLPGKYTCAGENVSPPLHWEVAADGVQSFVVTVIDPDAPNGDFTHWVLYNIPPLQNSLEENFRIENHRDWNAENGRNDFGNIGYGGPCPPVGSTHRYYFHVYALDTRLDIGTGATRAQVIDRMQGHILDNTQIFANFQRVRNP